jgi:AcrR family transcriptional regulator
VVRKRDLAPLKNTNDYSHFQFAFPRSHDDGSLNPQSFLTKTAETGPVGTACFGHIDGGCSGFGARRRASFTTARVAEKAGVSVGSLYQYFPNKEAILFRLQFDEWQQTTGLIERILTDRSLPPFDRVCTVIREFFRTECEEAEIRVALGDAAPFYRDAPEASEHRQSGMATMLVFLEEAIPMVSAGERAMAAELIAMTMSAVGERISEEGRSAPDVEAHAHAVGDMFCAYLESLSARAQRTPFLR